MTLRVVRDFLICSARTVRPNQELEQMRSPSDEGESKGRDLESIGGIMIGNQGKMLKDHMRCRVLILIYKDQG